MQDIPPPENVPSELGPSTAPDCFSITARGFRTEAHASNIGSLVGEYVRAFSRRFDLSQLDGVTVAYDYAQALLELDRGYETSLQLTASDGHVVGVAMTPSVLRNGALKSHILLNAQFVESIADREHENYRHALHIIGHECAHVEVTTRFDTAFPGVLLRQRYADLRIAFRWQIILACWDEYAATNLIAGTGEDQTDAYEDTFLRHLAETRQVANDSIRQYRIHGDVDQVLAEVYGIYGDLLKFAAYHLGNLDGQGIALRDRVRTVEALAGHWFAPYFERLHTASQAIADTYGQWPDQAPFEAIGDLADELVSLGGIHLSYPEPGRLYVDIPFALDTTPDEGD